MTRVLILSLPKRRGCGSSASGRRSGGRHDGHRCVRSFRLLGSSERDFLWMRCHFRLGCHVERRSRWWGMPQPLACNIEIEHGPRCKHPPCQLSLAWRGADTAVGLNGYCCSSCSCRLSTCEHSPGHWRVVRHLTFRKVVHFSSSFYVFVRT